MWIGGVRVVICDTEGKVLMVRQSHENRQIWMVPGGGIEAGETSREAAVREVEEETGLVIEVGALLWHVEDVSEERGQRFVNFFLGKIVGGQLAMGSDPEFDGENQVLREVGFFSLEEISQMETVYPTYLKTELGKAIKEAPEACNVYRIREKSKI